MGMQNSAGALLTVSCTCCGKASLESWHASPDAALMLMASASPPRGLHASTRECLGDGDACDGCLEAPIPCSFAAEVRGVVELEVGPETLMLASVPLSAGCRVWGADDLDDCARLADRSHPSSHCCASDCPEYRTYCSCSCCTPACMSKCGYLHAVLAVAMWPYRVHDAQEQCILVHC